ncbi:MAG TPA: heat-inducible transcriptional repressor HrcA [Methylomirabilota bacterium]|nr:heat-inducible transcriptional repressor HrcA [Methylomirabilota bacterium]
MSGPVLDKRNRQVLLAVIAEYVETGEPVGSRAVARRHIRGLSPATIRNAMADLEEMGYLVQPHTSAGRVPTDAAYRFYVDHLQRVPWGAGQAPAVGTPAGPPPDGAERLMAETPARLSSDTHMMGVLLAPPLKQTALDRIELVALDEHRALAVLVTETGWMTARPLAASPMGGADELRETGRALTRRFRGKTFQEILDELAGPPADPFDPLWTRHRSVLDEVVALLRDRTLYVSGATNMLDHPDLSDPAALRSMLRAFEDKARLADLLSRMAEERGIHVLIGSENPVEDLRGLSLITSTYTYRDQILGVLGVVGPRRMPYSDVMAVVDETARIVSSSLSRVRQHLYLP